MTKIYAAGHFQIDVERRQLVRDGEAVNVGSKAFDALVFLIEHRDRVLSKDELIQVVWHNRAVSDDLLPQTILALRRALGDDSGHPRFIATVPRRGYRFIADVQLNPDGGAASSVGPALESPAGELRQASTHSRWSARSAALVAVIAMAAGAVSLIRSQNASSSFVRVGRPLRFAQDAPPGTILRSRTAVSPDGRFVAFAAQETTSGKTHLWLRPVDNDQPQEIVGTEAGSDPFWSPDSRAIGFFAAGKLKRVALGGGSPETIADVGLSPAGGTWGLDDTIVFAPWKAGLSIVNATGGRASALTNLDASAQETAHQFPQFLPDGQHLLYYAASARTTVAGTYVIRIGSHEKTRLVDAPATFAAPGYLLWTREGSLVAQPFDDGRLKLTGAAADLVSGVAAGATASAGGGDILAVNRRAAAGPLTWYDRAGRVVGAIRAPVALHNVSFSPDFKHLMANSNDTTQQALWRVDLARDVATPYAIDGSSPWPSPDGARIAYTSDSMRGIADVYVRGTSGRQETFVFKTDENKIVNDWSPDGRYIVYVSTNPTTKKDIWLLPTGEADPKPLQYLRTPSNEIQGQVSPDGRWMAYASDESGSWEVYVQSFPTAGHKQTVSVGGGAQPRWRRDARELFYLSEDHTIMAVDVEPGESLTIGRPQVLFRAPIAGALNSFRSHYAVTADGQRFLIDTVDTRSSHDAITILVNWTAFASR